MQSSDGNNPGSVIEYCIVHHSTVQLIYEIMLKVPKFLNV